MNSNTLTDAEIAAIEDAVMDDGLIACESCPHNTVPETLCLKRPVCILETRLIAHLEGWL